MQLLMLNSLLAVFKSQPSSGRVCWYAYIHFSFGIYVNGISLIGGFQTFGTATATINDSVHFSCQFDATGGVIIDFCINI